MHKTYLSVAASFILPFTCLFLFSNLSVASPATQPSPSDHIVWEGRFDQCSFNAVSSMLAYYRGPLGPVKDRKATEEKLFFSPLRDVGYWGYFGWGPWTGYMVESGKMVWNGKPVTDLKSERFSLATHTMPTVEDNQVIVHYAEGERKQLREKLLRELAKGPVILWTPYAGALDDQTPPDPWHHVQRIDSVTDSVSFRSAVTHSVTLFLKPGGEVEVTDCSVRNGIYITDASTIVSTAAAMVGVVHAPMDGGKSLYAGGFNGIKGDEYNTVFFPVGSPTTQPAAAAEPSKILPTEVVPAEYRDKVNAALDRAGSRRGVWIDMLTKVPAGQREAASYLLSYLPQRDLDDLDPQWALEAVDHACQARKDSPWGKSYPDEIFLQAVLPIANLSETRECWWDDLGPICKPMVSDCVTSGQAALKLNAGLFKAVHVSYHPTKRPRPDQSPAESITANYASCSGLSILLVDACRSVGVPARVAGTPLWFTGKGDANGNHAGNHTWVEIWDGQWHVIGASEVSPLDQTWFLDNARKQVAVADDPKFGIYAAAFGASKISFPMVWDLDADYVPAENVTVHYAPRVPIYFAAPHPGRLILRQSGQLIADVQVDKPVSLLVCPGQSYDAQLMIGAGLTPEAGQRVSIPANVAPGFKIDVSE